MKKNIFYAIIFGMTLTFGSCTDYLEKESKQRSTLPYPSRISTISRDSLRKSTTQFLTRRSTTTVCHSTGVMTKS